MTEGPADDTTLPGTALTIALADTALVTPSIARALETAQAYVERALADGTNDVYARAWALFAAWCGREGLEPLPCSSATLAAFLAHHAGPHERPVWTGGGPATVRCDGLSPPRLEVFRAAVRKEHAFAGHPDPGADPLIGKMLRGIRRAWADQGREKRQVEALTASAHGAGEAATLRLVVEAIDIAHRRGVRDAALMLVGFAGALRRSELCRLVWGDVRPKAGGVNLLLRRSKTDKEARGQTVGLPRVGGPLCPVGALAAWKRTLQLAGRSAGAGDPVFRDVDRWGNVSAAPLHPSTVARIVKRLVEAVPTDGLDEDLRRRLDPARYAGHSLRAGFVTTAALEGKDIIDILMTTRHAEPKTVIEYVRQERLASRNAVRDALARREDDPKPAG